MITYRTSVLRLPETPLGLLQQRWSVQHHCTACRHHVEPDQLIIHARDHEREEAITT